MDYSATYAIVTVAGFSLSAWVLLRRGVHVRGMDISLPGIRAKADELIVGADHEHRAEEHHAVEVRVEAVEPGVGAEKLPPSEKPASIEPKREGSGELAA